MNAFFLEIYILKNLEPFREMVDLAGKVLEKLGEGESPDAELKNMEEIYKKLEEEAP